MPRWTWIAPGIALLSIAVGYLYQPGALTGLVFSAFLIGAVLAAVHHAEDIAHRVGEPYGALVLALAVTVIEVSLMVSMMLGGGPDVATLPRDTLFATVMIIVNGVIGLCLLLGGIKHHEQSFRREGTSSALAALVVLSILTMVLPTLTVSSPGATYTGKQLAFAAIASLVMWCVFIFSQTIRHRDHFHVVDAPGAPIAAPVVVVGGSLWASLALLLLALIGVVGLAKILSPLITAGVAVTGAPKAVIGIAIAMLVLLPETLAAVRYARANQLQISINLAFGSALATIGLTIPAVALVSTILGLELTMGLDAKDSVLLFVSFLVSAITLGHGSSTIMQGAIHLVLFASFLVLALIP